MSSQVAFRHCRGLSAIVVFCYHNVGWVFVSNTCVSTRSEEGKPTTGRHIYEWTTWLEAETVGLLDAAYYQTRVLPESKVTETQALLATL